jgi:hypothetical protein
MIKLALKPTMIVLERTHCWWLHTHKLLTRKLPPNIMLQQSLADLL